MKLSKIKILNQEKYGSMKLLILHNGLPKEDNINILCEALDLNIEYKNRSARRYNVDIVADDIDNNCKVIIENQLKLLTTNI